MLLLPREKSNTGSVTPDQSPLEAIMYLMLTRLVEGFFCLSDMFSGLWGTCLHLTTGKRALTLIVCGIFEPQVQR